jgi:hypothetical protein
MNMRVLVVVAFIILTMIPLASAANVTMTLNAGFNLVAAPLNNILGPGVNGPTPVSTIDDYLYTIDDAAQGSCGTAYAWQGSTWLIHVYLTGLNNWAYDYSAGNWIVCSRDMSITFEGVPFPETTQLELTTGYNLISVPIHIGPRDIIRASDILAQANEQGVDASIMYNWNGAGYDIAVHQNGQVMGNNFRIENGHGYWLFTSNTGTVEISK